MVIYKYPLAVTDRQVMTMPIGAQLLCVQVQRGIPTLWARVDPIHEMEEVILLTKGTGHPFPEINVSYLGTYQLAQQLVFHVFHLHNHPRGV